MGRYFGTDGIRGRVGEPLMSPDFILKLGHAAGRVLARQSRGAAKRPAVLIGKDTRISGYMIESALEAGLSAAGVDVVLCGPLPTPGVAPASFGCTPPRNPQRARPRAAQSRPLLCWPSPAPPLVLAC